MSNVISNLLHKTALHYLPIKQLEVDPEQPGCELKAPNKVNKVRTLTGLAESIK